MALLKFTSIGIKTISTTVPKNKVKTIEQTKYFSKKHLENFINTTGVEERRIADKDTCASDLCYNAAINLFEQTDTNPEEIDALIFLSQTPDYRVPGTSIILQNKLGLDKGTIAFDVNLTCSGYIYGLFLAYSLANVSGINNVLLLVGETLSKITSANDKSTGLLLGDGGSATLINKNNKYGESFFSLNTDGESYESVIIPGGGFRNMSSKETLTEKTDEGGNVRNDEQIRMDGLDVFSFAVSKIPKDVKNLLEFANLDLSIIDKIVFHQSNRYMMDVIAKKAKADRSKMLYSIQKYGNTSGVSIPLTIADQKSLINNNDVLLLNGIGAGFSWGSTVLKLVDCTILNVNEI
jgi:3-oxoacyl-[acyl-carrier-protein] synthase-3